MSGYLDHLSEWWPALLQGLGVTLLVSIASMVMAVGVGLLIALIRLTDLPGPLRFLKWVLRAYIEVMRGLPIIIILFIIYFALPSLGLTIVSDPLVAGVLGITLALSAYLSEVFRAAIISVDAGQTEAAMAFGMTKAQAYRRIILPQAMVVATPTLGGYFISLLKDSSLLGFVGVTELLRTGVVLVSVTFRAAEIYLTIGCMYLVLSFSAAWLVSRIERRLTPFWRPHASTLTGVPPAGPTLSVIKSS